MTKTHKTLAASAAFLSCWLGSSAFAAPDEVAEKVDAYMHAGVRIGRFSCAVLIARGDNVLVGRGYGVANREEDVPIMPYTKFRLASVTKQFTAMSILILEGRGLLKVTDPVLKHLADSPAAWSAVTIHHLLTHTSGIPDYAQLANSRELHKLPTSVASLLGRFKDQPLEFTPGEQFRYSNSGYAVLGAIIERVSGKTYQAFLRENVFEPLKMNASGYDDDALILKHRARGYARNGDQLRNADYIDISNPYAAGGLYSTVEDLYLWSRELSKPTLVSSEALARMTTPYKHDYAYGLVVQDEGGRKCISHSGVIDGFTSFVGRYPNDGVTIIVLSNLSSSPSASIARDLAAIVFGEKYEVPADHKAIRVDPKIFDALVGEYEREPGKNMRVFVNGDRLWLGFPGRPTVQLLPEAEDRYFIEVMDIQFTFVKDEGGRVTQLILHQLGQDIPVKKVK